MVLAAGCLLALLVAVPFVVGTPAIELRRRLEPERVTVGEPAVAEMTATNTRSRRARRLRVEEHVGESTVAIEVPSLAPGGEHSTMYALPTRRRGDLPGRTGRGHPSRPAGTAAPSGHAHQGRHVVGASRAGRCSSRCPSGSPRTSKVPPPMPRPAGDVAFHAIRPYQYGDDPRHIHWMSTARTGSVMVRHYVDNRRPNLGVLFDTDPAGVRRRAVRDGRRDRHLDDAVVTRRPAPRHGRHEHVVAARAPQAGRPRHDPRTPHRRPTRGRAAPRRGRLARLAARARHVGGRHRHRRPRPDRPAPLRRPRSSPRPADRDQREDRRQRAGGDPRRPAHQRRLARRVPGGVEREHRHERSDGIDRLRRRGGVRRRHDRDRQRRVVQHPAAVELPRSGDRSARSAPRP